MALAKLLSRRWVLLTAACLSLLACSGGDEVLSRADTDFPGQRIGAATWVPACEDGEVQACSITLSVHDGVASCYEGVRTCIQGRFGDCSDGTSFELRTAASGHLGTLSSLAFSLPADCTDNPCNAYCREFIEAPSAGLSADVDALAPPVADWNTGLLSQYPADAQARGAQSPCEMGEDCQLDTKCVDPSLGACTHSVCESGPALASGCGQCADTVCAADPDCCGTTTACAHDPCQVDTGAPLSPACDTCVAAVCAVDSTCCTTTWNAACVALVASECASLGQACGCPDGGVLGDGRCYLPNDTLSGWDQARDTCVLVGESWGLSEIEDADENTVVDDLVSSSGFASAWIGGQESNTDEWSWLSGGLFFTNDASGGALQNGFTFENWETGHPVLGGVGEAITLQAGGLWRGELRSEPRESVCEGPPNFLTPQQSPIFWDDACVALAESECGVECPDTHVPVGLGVCTPRVKSELQSGCSSFDLSVGATCEDAGTPQVPVCNHGQAPAPAGLTIGFLPPGQLGAVTPDQTAATYCTLVDPIPPGRCVAVTDCLGIGAGDEIFVNPVDGSEDATECRFDNNWGIYQPLSCSRPLCESQTVDAAQTANSGCSLPIEHPVQLEPADARVLLETGVTERSCADDEVLWGNSCYYFATDPGFAPPFNWDSKTWNDARDECLGRGPGWDLIALNSPAENVFARNEFDDTFSLFFDTDIHIGYNDKLVEGAHEWSNGSCGSWVYWRPLQPNGGLSQQCARITTGGDGYDWEDKECATTLHPYICEGPIRNPQAGCGPGEVAGPNNSCYFFDPTPVTWSDADTTCRNRGAGFSQLSIDDTDTNDFATSLIECGQAWLANPAGALEPWDPLLHPDPSAIDPSHSPLMNEFGFWEARSNPADTAGTLCVGPKSATGVQTLTQVPDAASCGVDDDEYYLATASGRPEALVMCPGTCSVAGGLPASRLQVEIPCGPPAPPAVDTVLDAMYYETDCAGGAGQWDFLYYDAVTPGDSRIELSVRTDRSVADIGLNSPPYVLAATAQAVPVDTQRCEIDPPSCPIDLFEVLGTPANIQGALELQVRLIPGTNGENPWLRDWRVRFSCPPEQ